MTIRILVGVLGLFGCSGKGDDSTASGDGSGTDLDDDGFLAADDCDDSDGAINPDATEMCDGLDNDCDGTTDLGAVDGVEYWSDSDADGYGAGAPASACAQPAGSADNGDDCDDADAAINPAAVELCDDLDTDEDCDTLVDDDDTVDASTTTTWYADADGDTYGDSAVTVTRCDLAPGYASASGDCDDGDGAVHPGAEELCGDSIDDDCDGSAVNGCQRLGAFDSGDADASIIGVTNFGYLGSNLTGAGDTNGDGYDDLLIGTTLAGTAYLFLGPVPRMESDADTGAAVFTSSNAGDGNGLRNAGIGDQDGDGYDDLVVGAFAYGDHFGRAYVILGPASGTSSTDSVAAATITGDSAFQDSGWQTSSGDVNGDGTRDIVVGGPGGSNERGAAFAFFGPVTAGDMVVSEADATFNGASEFSWTGGCNAANGDIDGDGVDDLLVGAEQAEVTGNNNGEVWLFYGPVGSGSYKVSDADVHVSGSADDDAHLGSTSSIGGDVDGDGLADLSVGAPGASEGDVYLFYAATVTASSDLDVATADAWISGDVVGDAFGTGLDTAGDFDGDGTDDLVASAPKHAGFNGESYLFYGPISGMLGAAAADFAMSGIAGEQVGSTVSFPGDLDSDGFADLAVAATYHSGFYSNAGVAYVMYGSGP